MSTATTTRPRPPAPVERRSPRARSPWRDAVVSVVAVGVVAGGAWGMTAPRDAHEDGAAHSHGSSALATVDLPDGTLRVDGLVDKQVGHVMAGMSMAEDVPAGMRRFSVNVSLGATEDESLTYTRRDFTVFGPGVKPVVPVDGQIDGGTVTPGMAVSGSLSFDVPKETTSLSLRFRDTEAVALPALPPVADGQHAEHGGAGAPAGKAPGKATAKAPAKAPADHHDAPGSPAHEH